MSSRGFKTVKSKTDTKKDDSKTATFAYTPSWKLLVQAHKLLYRNRSAAVFILLVPNLFAQLGNSLVRNFKTVDPFTILGVLVLVVATAWLLINFGVTIYFQLRIISGKKPGIVECYRHGVRYLPRLLALSIVVGFVIVGGLILFIVPGLICIRRYLLASYFMVDSNLGIREAMHRSAEATKPAKGYVWSTIIMVLVVGGGVAAIAQYLPQPYANIVTILLVTGVTCVPVLRYREVALHKSALEV